MKKKQYQSGSAHIVVVILIILALIGALGFVYWRNFMQTKSETDDKTNTGKTTVTVAGNTEPATADVVDLTNDQLFQEVSSQLNLSRDSLRYFRIFAQDKVSFNDGSGSNFAYKQDGVWKKTSPTGRMDIALCADYADVPENYRPMCLNGSSEILYSEGSSSSVNYPGSLMTSYIGQ